MNRDAPSARDVALVVLVKAGVSALVLASGFRAVSDDDFARVVIAQRFAAEPALDPTGTSWLPFPFWLQGGVMMIFGRSIEVARATSLSLGVGAACVVLLAGHWLGLTRRAALLGALVALAFPYAAWLGVATVPDYPAAALIVLGVAAASSDDGRRRLIGALALGVAALSRYEAWPVAAGFALFSSIEATRSRRALLALPAVLALAGPLGWLAHGALTHGDALFFVARVSAYKRAVGGALPALSALIHQPLAVLRCEPELAGATLVGLGTALATGQTALLRRHARGALLLGLLLVFLVVGELRASGATHHSERAVLSIWLWLALVFADLASSTWAALPGRARQLAAGALVLAIGLGALVLRPWYARRDSFVDRSSEIGIGRKAASLAAGSGALFVDTPDFGFYAVMAGFGAPERAEPFDDRDPRRTERRDPFESEASLRDHVMRESAGQTSFLVVSFEHRALAERLGPVEHQTGPLVLVRVGRR